MFKRRFIDDWSWRVLGEGLDGTGRFVIMIIIVVVID